MLDETSEKEAEEVAEFHWALFYYYSQKWDQALQVLERLKEKHKLKIYDLYIERIGELREQDLGEDWDGVFTHTSK